MPAAPLPAPSFAAVTVLASSSATSASSSLLRDITLTLHLPHDVVATVTGLDADTVTLLALEVLQAVTRGPRA